MKVVYTIDVDEDGRYGTESLEIDGRELILDWERKNYGACITKIDGATDIASFFFANEESDDEAIGLICDFFNTEDLTSELMNIKYNSYERRGNNYYDTEETN